MADEKYRVEYHVIQAIYFDPARPMSGSDYAKLWAGTSIYRKPRGAAGGFWHLGGPIVKAKPFPLGSLVHLESLLDEQNTPIYGGATYTRPHVARGSTVDCDFYYAHSDASNSFGFETLPSLLYSVSGQWFKKAGAKAVIEHMWQHFEVADQYAPPYGLIDVALPEDGYGGMVYTDTFFANSLVHRWVEREKWLRACAKRRDKVRGIYWGNYLGREILDRLGGRQLFLSGLRSFLATRTANPDDLIREYRHGIVLTLCADLLDCRPSQPLGLAGSVVGWLVHEFMEHRIFAGGPEDLN